MHVAPSFSPIMPLRIADAGASIEREAGRQRMQHRAALPRRCARRRLRARDARRGSLTAWPPMRTFALADAREPSRPPVRLTMTLSACTPAMRSAASTARRIAFSASSMSTTTPALRPRERWWPMPRMRQRVRAAAQQVGRVGRHQPRDQAHDLGRADVEHGQDRALARRQRLHARRDANAPLMLDPLRPAGLLGFGARGGGFFRQARDDAVGHAQVDGDEILVEIFCSCAQPARARRWPLPRRFPAASRRRRGRA